MPAKGKHRRPKSSSTLTRGFVAAGTGGAALALPLIGATGAQAAQPASAPAVAPGHAGPSEAQQAPKIQLPQQRTAERAAAPTTDTARAATRTYSVVSGDHLSKIAAAEQVRGGWQKLYEDNRSVVGGDPSLIHPGMKLSIGAKASGAKAAPAAKPQAAPAERKASERKAERTEVRTEKRAEKREQRTEKREQRTERRSESRAQSASSGSSSGFTAPVPSGVSTPYRASGGSWSSGYHTGVDFRASSGTSVKAVGPGTVVSAGWSGSYGNEVVIRHNDGHYSQYAHLSALNVRSGQSVSGGQQIGYSGSTGNSTGPHLHFEIRTGPGYGSDVDPLNYLRRNGVSI
ncbi:peptidoglycan DD-metalloendopeptidase family protein [Streptomyces sp. NPDC058657]|uniref:M23 family metallopeptidase n=1 Tax=unclassified Streptomyces TaxID=2593676 RepID=UPI003651A82F